ncbi:MAG: ATP-binding protein [Pyrinomonadaceae bacterium]
MEFIPNSQTLDIFKNVFAFFGTLSSKGYVHSLDGKVFERTATEPELLIGQKFSETVYWQSSEHISGQINSVITESAKGNKAKILVDFRVSANEIINIELYLQPIIENEEVRQIFFCAQEVTAREKEIEYYKERSEHLLYAAENAEVGLWYWDLSKDKIYSTPKCNELFEIPAHDVITLDSFIKIVHPEDRSRVESALQESQTHGREYNTECRVIYSDGNIHWIGARGKTYLDDEGNPKIMMGVVRKVTDKKLANEELSKVYAREKKARDEAEEANRAKDFFLAVVSHELRSPLNAILGWTKILLTKEVDEETRINALETIEKSARSQAKLIEDLIDSSRVSSGKLRLELRPLNLYEVIKTAYNLQQPAAEAKNLNLEFSADAENIQVYGDTFRLQQIFTNLLSNSLKFTEKGGNIRIIVQSDSNLVKIIIQDDGQGISPSALPNIFRQFRQDDERKSLDRSGLGLGLSIVKILVEKHKGKIEAKSDGTGKGSTFTVTLPLCGTETSASTKIRQSGTRESGTKEVKYLNGIKVLVVEDDPDSREVLHFLLEQSGAEVKSTESAQEAMSLLRESGDNLPDVIVSDLAMPNEDGYSLIERIRKLTVETGGKIPALALSAFASNDNKTKAYNAGFQKYHTKPFEPDGIIQDILQLVKK